MGKSWYRGYLAHASTSRPGWVTRPYGLALIGKLGLTLASDDCIAINNGSSFINISGIFCGPGHGISSIGSGNELNTYLNPRGGSGYARNITYEDIILVGVKHPVIIDQFYDPKYIDNVGQAVEVSDVTYLNIRGTSLDKIAIELNCDTIVGCTNIVLDNVNITHVDGGEAQTICTKAKGRCSTLSFNNFHHVLHYYTVLIALK
ncbi:hypothetical protein TSUD_412190 [Trifolium subterraneum]|uniref:Polygalacturonase n=1 Tax=Trifolium subterraneum TaxID=3900 RepID=A0A2Z6PIJ1_TRISU|nr:hypothetical protein TSUD_412190 [Trifolium subterraneum]